MFKAIIKIFFLLLWLMLACLCAWVIKKLGNKKLFISFCNFGFAGICFIVGLRVKAIGEITNARPLLLISNHLSYLDVLALGAKTPAKFTPKSEVSSWPVIGWICRLLDSVFIERKSNKIKDASLKMKEALVAGEVVSFFAEGTTGDGRHLLPFKSSLFSIAEEKLNGAEILLQPVIIKYTHIGNLPIESTQWAKIAWYGDMFLAPHFLEVLQLGKIDVSLIVLPPISFSQIGDRKKLASYCQKQAEAVLK